MGDDDFYQGSMLAAGILFLKNKGISQLIFFGLSYRSLFF